MARGWMILLLVAGAPVTAAAAEPERPLEHFEQKVRPLLAARCWKCHGPDKQKSDLRLDTAEGLHRGNKLGPVVVPGSPDESRLVKAIRRTGEIKMPPDESLADDEIADLVAWVRAGAVWPDTTVTRPEGEPPDGSLFSDEEKSYWAFQPIGDPEPSEVQGTEWVKSDVDRFILAGLEAKGLSPASSADKRTLLRRVTFDLIGLPPTPEQLAAFLADETPEAFANVVDRLLESVHYGERWGRHWLSVVRYGDTADTTGCMASFYAYRYRDYVVRALNQDKPYNEFIIEQLAGDLLEPSGNISLDAERVIATGFLMLGPKPITEIDKEKMIVEIVDEQIDVTCRTFLGLTVSCARCHDHKFDPIPTRDYYSMAGIFYSTQTMADRKVVDSKWMERPLLNLPGASQPVMVLAVQDGEPTNLRVHIRGSHRDLGEEVPRRFLQIVAGENCPPIQTRASGRLELARWIASADNPLTARVMVNRIWQGHFGRGLVATSDNFGLLGEPPSHPELLDWLASRLIEGGWSVKAMHRLLLNTSTYQMGSVPHDLSAAQQVDPDNRLWWRMNPRRLEAEEIRDAILAVSGQLDPAVGGTLFHRDLRYISTIVDQGRGIYVLNLVGRTYHPYFSSRRSIYLPMIRQKIPEIFQLFDFGDANTVTTSRNESTVAPQALYSMNSPFIREQSFHWARQLLSLADTNDEDRVRLAYRKLLSRPSSEEEITTAIEYVAGLERALDDSGRAQAAVFPHGAELTVTVERANHNLGLFPEFKPILDKPSGVRLRFSATSAERPRANRNNVLDWTVMTPVQTTAASGAALTIGPDQTVMISGSDPTLDTYQIVVPTDLPRVTAIRLEVLPDPAEPPERSIPDLFVLADCRVRATPRAGPTEQPTEDRVVRWQHATLKLPGRDVSIFPAIDGDLSTNWHVGPDHDQPGIVIFETENSRLTAWQSYCRALICLNEFVYLE